MSSPVIRLLLSGAGVFTHSVLDLKTPYLTHCANNANVCVNHFNFPNMVFVINHVTDLVVLNSLF